MRIKHFCSLQRQNDIILRQRYPLMNEKGEVLPQSKVGEKGSRRKEEADGVFKLEWQGGREVVGGGGDPKKFSSQKCQCGMGWLAAE